MAVSLQVSAKDETLNKRGEKVPSVASAVFDLVMLAVLAAMVIIGRKTGLLRMLFILGIVFFAALIAKISLPLVNSALTQMKVGESVKNSVKSTVMNWTEQDESLDFEGVAKKMGLPDEVAAMAERSVEGIKQEKGEALAEKTAGFIAGVTVKLISYAAVAVIVIIVLIILSLVTKLINKIPVLGTANAIGGMIAGLAAGILTVFLICVLVSSAGIGSTSGTVSDITHKSYIIKAFSKIGLIGGIIK